MQVRLPTAPVLSCRRDHPSRSLPVERKPALAQALRRAKERLRYKRTVIQGASDRQAIMFS